jgi:uncharacterized membrane protein
LIVLLSLPAAVFAQAPQPGKLDLTFYITGGYPNNITPGQANQQFAVIRNNGNTTLTNIRFSANAPQGWTVNFNPARLDSLDINSSNTIEVNITPSSGASKGNYNITLIADANETRAVTDAFLRVEGGISYWLWVGIGIAALVIIGFIIVFLRFGRG